MDRAARGINASVRVPQALRREVVRSALLERIERADDAKVIALAAPSGFGKTTLLAQLARAAAEQIAWLTLEVEDADPASLARRLAASVRQAAPDLTLRAFEESFSSPNFPGNAARALAQDLALHDKNLRIVIDQVQHLGTDAAQWLEGFLTYLEEGHQVLLGGFEPLPVRLARLVARGEAIVLSANELAFTHEESIALLAARGLTNVGEETLRRVEGWAAGLALLPTADSERLSPELLVEDAIAQLPEETEQRLPYVSVIETWSEDTPAGLNLEFPSNWLRDLRRLGLPITPLGNGLFRPHQILLEELEKRLRAQPAMHARLQTAAAIMAEQSGSPMLAVRRYLRAGALEKAIEIAGELVSRFEDKREYALVRQVLYAFPKRTLPPSLLASLGVAQVREGDLNSGEESLNLAQTMGGADAQVAFGLALIVSLRGDIENSLRLSMAALQTAQSPLLKSRLMRLKANALWRNGNNAAALECVRESVKQGAGIENRQEYASALGEMAMLVARITPQDAEVPIKRAMRAYDEANLERGTISLYDELATIQCMQGKTEAALESIDAGLIVAEREGSAEIAYLLQTKGDIHLWRKEHDLAMQSFQGAIEKNAQLGNKVSDHMLRFKLIEVARRAGNASVAQHARDELSSMDRPDFEAFRVAASFYDGLEAFAAGNLELAQSALIAAVSLASHPERRARAKAFLGEIARRTGALKPTHVAQLLEETATLGSEAVLEVDADLIPDFYNTLPALNPSYKRFSRHAGEAVVQPPVHGTATILEVRTCGALEVRIDGSTVKLPHRKTRELLVWLACHGAQRRETIVDALWGGDNDHSNIEYFKITVRRLRASLSEHPSVAFNPLPFEDDRYTLSDRFAIEVDVLEAQRALTERDEAQMRRCTQRYAGPFMHGVDAEWIDEQRTRALDTAIALNMTLVGRTQDPREAEACLRRVVLLEPLYEDAHRALVKNLYDQGQHEAARGAYNQYERMLDLEFGTQPPAAITKLFQRQPT